MTLLAEPDLGLLSLYRLTARLLAAAVALTGLAVCVGRLSDNAYLSTVSGGTGVAFLLGGSATVLLLFAKNKPVFAAGQTLACLAALLCGLNVAHWFFNVDLITYLGQMLPEEAQSLTAQSQNDSVQMTLIAVSLILLRAPLLRKVPQIAAADPFIICAGLISLMTLLGLIFGVPNFCLFVSCLRISPLGGIGFAMFCLALLFAKTDEGIFAMLCRRDSGGVLARRFLPAVALMPLLLGWLRMQGQSIKAFDAETGLAIMIIAMITLSLGIIWWTSRSLSQADLARQVALNNLEQSEKRARMIVEQAIDAFLAIDSRGEIKDWNFKAERTFGWSRSEAIGRKPLNTIVPPDQLELELLLAKDDATAPQKPLETLMLHKLGHSFCAELSLFSVVVDNEKIRCAFVRDITERKELEQRLHDFYANVAHELRTPLTSIRCCLSLVKQFNGNLPDNLHAGVIIADSSVDRLMRLINDLLDVKRIEEGKLELELELLPSLPLLIQAAEELRGVAQANNIELVPVVDHEAFIEADRDRIIQVFTNLIANAINYSPPGSQVVIKTEEGAPGFLRFSVNDSGPGIPVEQLHKLFTMFGQAGKPEGRRVPSSGLGLLICKSIVEQHGGRIGLETAPGKGCKFWFDMPLMPKTDKQLIVSEEVNSQR